MSIRVQQKQESGLYLNNCLLPQVLNPYNFLVKKLVKILKTGYPKLLSLLDFNHFVHRVRSPSRARIRKKDSIAAMSLSLR